MAGGVSICLYECVSLLALKCVACLCVHVCVCVCVCVCVISIQSTSKKPQYVPGLNKLDALLHKTYSKVLLVLRYQFSIISLSKITHQMCRDHPLSQRNKTSKIVEGWRRQGRGVRQNLKNRGR